MYDQKESNLIPDISNTNTTSHNSILRELVKVLSEVELDSPEAAVNEHSISDNNGGRIML